MTEDHLIEFTEECHSLSLTARDAIARILLSDDRVNKHKPWTWKAENIEGHLIKAARHILTHLNIEGGHQKPSGEDHLDNAMCRLAMALNMYMERRTTIPKPGAPNGD